MVDLRTPKEKEREERNRLIRSDYHNIKHENANTADYRIFEAIAKKYKLSWVTVRKIVLNA